MLMCWLTLPLGAFGNLDESGPWRKQGKPAIAGCNVADQNGVEGAPVVFAGALQ